MREQLTPIDTIKTSLSEPYLWCICEGFRGASSNIYLKKLYIINIYREGRLSEGCTPAVKVPSGPSFRTRIIPIRFGSLFAEPPYGRLIATGEFSYREIFLFFSNFGHSQRLPLPPKKKIIKKIKFLLLKWYTIALCNMAPRGLRASPLCRESCARLLVNG